MAGVDAVHPFISETSRKLLDHLEEGIIAFLIAAATVLIFVAVLRRLRVTIDSNKGMLISRGWFLHGIAKEGTAATT